MAGPSSLSSSSAHRSRQGLLRSLPHAALLSLTMAFAALALAPAIAFAGEASSGELLFYPCTSCHPVTLEPGGGKPVGAKPLPNDFPGHEVVLEGHDALGAGDAACLACHDDPTKDPGKLKLADGTLVDITGDTAQVCYRCHQEKYKEWKAGTHGKDLPKCTASGCHNPHAPRWIYAEPLLPFQGTGFQFKALSGREPFLPLAPPAPQPPAETPLWFLTAVVVGIAAAGGQITRLVRGRHVR